MKHYLEGVLSWTLRARAGFSLGHASGVLGDNTDAWRRWFPRYSVALLLHSVRARNVSLALGAVQRCAHERRLVVLAVGTFTAFIVYARLGDVTDWEKWASKRTGKISGHFLVGAALGLVLYVPFNRIEKGIGLLDTVFMFSSISSCVALILDTTFSITLSSSLLEEIPLVLILHAISFFSNSFTFWEDRMVPFLLITSLPTQHQDWHHLSGQETPKTAFLCSLCCSRFV